MRGLDISSNFSLHFGARGALPLGPATYRSTAAAAAATTAGPLPTLLLLLPFMTLAAGIRVSSCVNAECPDMCCRMFPHVVHLSRNFSLHLCARKLLHNVISQKISRNLQRGFTKLLKEICGGSARNLRPRQVTGHKLTASQPHSLTKPHSVTGLQITPHSRTKPHSLTGLHIAVHNIPTSAWTRGLHASYGFV